MALKIQPPFQIPPGLAELRPGICRPSLAIQVHRAVGDPVDWLRVTVALDRHLLPIDVDRQPRLLQDALSDLLLNFKRRKRGGRHQRGPRSHSQEMKATLRVLHEEGRRFSSKKAAYRAVIERLKVPDTARGWSYSTFARLDLED